MLKTHAVDCFDISCKQMGRTVEKGKTVKFKHYMRTRKPPFMIYANLESILAPEREMKSKTKIGLIQINIKVM